MKIPWIDVDTSTGVYSFKYKGEKYTNKVQPAWKVWTVAIMQCIEVFEEEG